LDGQASAAGDAPSVEEVKAAESDFNKGREAYKAGNYDEAAEYFESADGHAPNERVIELAINARDKAGHLDRAATSAEWALELYPNAARIKKVALPIIERAKTELFTVIVTCDEACNLLDGSRLVHGESATRRVVFLTPGDHEIRASWSEGRVLSQQTTGKTGDTINLEFKAPPVPKKPETEVAPTVAAPMGPDRAQEKPHGMTPIVFWSGVGATAILGGVTVWSGIDTTKNPGSDAVRTACNSAGQVNCQSLYDQGKAHELRTNILIAATSVVGAATAVIGGFFTNWSGKKEPEADTARITPWVTYANGPAVGATGRF
jgi:tetratricopeptide (TPR) repeat protein